MTEPFPLLNGPKPYKRSWAKYWCPTGCGKRVVFQAHLHSRSPQHRFACEKCGWGCTDRATLQQLQWHDSEALG